MTTTNLEADPDVDRPFRFQCWLDVLGEFGNHRRRPEYGGPVEVGRGRPDCIQYRRVPRSWDHIPVVHRHYSGRPHVSFQGAALVVARGDPDVRREGRRRVDRHVGRGRNLAWTVKSFATTSLSAGDHTISSRASPPAAPSNLYLDSVAITDPSGNPVSLQNPSFDTYSISDATILNPPAIATPIYRTVASVTTCGKLPKSAGWSPSGRVDRLARSAQRGPRSST